MIGNPTLDLQTDMSPATEEEKWLAERGYRGTSLGTPSSGAFVSEIIFDSQRPKITEQEAERSTLFLDPTRPQGRTSPCMNLISGIVEVIQKNRLRKFTVSKRET